MNFKVLRYTHVRGYEPLPWTVQLASDPLPCSQFAESLLCHLTRRSPSHNSAGYRFSSAGLGGPQSLHFTSPGDAAGLTDHSPKTRAGGTREIRYLDGQRQHKTGH